MMQQAGIRSRAGILMWRGALEHIARRAGMPRTTNVKAARKAKKAAKRVEAKSAGKKPATPKRSTAR